jgi:hypothetical protein
MKTWVAGSSGTLVPIYQITRRQIPEDHNHDRFCCSLIVISAWNIMHVLVTNSMKQESLRKLYSLIRPRNSPSFVTREVSLSSSQEQATAPIRDPYESVPHVHSLFKVSFNSNRDFTLSAVSRPALGPTQPPIQWVPGGKAAGGKADHSHLVPRSNGGAIPPLSHTSSWRDALHLIVIPHVLLDFQSGLFPSSFLSENLYEFQLIFLSFIWSFHIENYRSAAIPMSPPKRYKWDISLYGFLICSDGPTLLYLTL